MQRSRSVVSNSPISIPSYALTKLRSFYKAPEQVEEERLSGSREGLTGGQRAGTFAYYIVILVLRVLRYRSAGISPPHRAKRVAEGSTGGVERRARWGAYLLAEKFTTGRRDTESWMSRPKESGSLSQRTIRPLFNYFGLAQTVLLTPRRRG